MRTLVVRQKWRLQTIGEVLKKPFLNLDYLLKALQKIKVLWDKKEDLMA